MPAQTAEGSPLGAANAVMNVAGKFYTPPASGQVPLTFTGNVNPGPALLDFEVPTAFASFSVQAKMNVNRNIPLTVLNPPNSLTTKFYKATGFFKGARYNTQFGTVKGHITTAGALIQGPVNVGGGAVFTKPFTGSGVFEILPQ